MNTSEKINLPRSSRELYQAIRDFYEHDYIIKSNMTFDNVNINLKESDIAFLIEVDLKDIRLKSIKVKYHEKDIIVEIDHIEDRKCCGIGFESNRQSIMEIRRKFRVGKINEDCIECACDDNKLLVIYAPKH